MGFYALMFFVSLAYADSVFRVHSSTGFCKLSYEAAHAECKLHGAHLATEAEVETLNTSPCPTCGWTLDKTSVCPEIPTDLSCDLRCKQKGGDLHDAWCYSGGRVRMCSTALGADDLYQLRASSEKHDWWRVGRNRWSAKIARLHNGDSVNAWMPSKNREGEFLEVKFNSLTAVTGLVTQGASRMGNTMWVTKYKVKYSRDDVNFEFITEEGEAKIFDGNVNNNGLKRNMFPESVLAQSIRIFPVRYHGDVAMRIEVLGCEMEVYKTV